MYISIFKNRVVEIMLSYGHMFLSNDENICGIRGYVIRFFQDVENYVIPELILPAEIDNEPIKGLMGFGAPEDGRGARKLRIKHLVIPDSVVEVKTFAFDGCKNIDSVTWSRNCSYVPESCFGHSKIKEVNFPEGVIEIGEAAFINSQIQNVSIPNSCKCIDTDAFKNCESLKEIIIPSGVSKIGNTAFQNTKIKEFIWPDNCSVVPYGCFADCSYLETLVFKGFLSEINTSSIENTPKLQLVNFGNVFSNCKVSSLFMHNIKKRAKNIIYPFYGSIIED